MFAYCGNNPVMHCDPLGLIAVTLPMSSKTQSLRDTAQGGGGVVILPNFSAVEDVIESIETLVTSIAASEDQREYSVYFLYEAGGDPSKIVYVGRVKTSNFNSRMAYHETKGRALAGYVSNLDYATCRAFEQAGMLIFHTINREDKLYNQIRGISPLNPNAQDYVRSVLRLIEQGQYPNNSWIPSSFWDNWIENEMLNGFF